MALISVRNQKCFKPNVAFQNWLQLTRRESLLSFARFILHATRASEKKFFRGYESRYRAPKPYLALQTLSWPMPLNHFLSAGCRSSLKSEEITIFAYSCDL